MAKIRIGISTCLLGENVRFDGGHKRDRLLLDALGPYCEWVPVCPEFEMGLGAPRESLRLVGKPESPRLIEPATGIDRTDPMRRFNKQRLRALADEGLSGFILKKDSPTCGLERVRVWHESQGGYAKQGVGLWAEDLLAQFPLLPVEEEGRLRDPRLRENFIDRIFCYYRWQTLVSERPRARDLIDFHTAHKLTLLSHSPKHYRELGQLVARVKERPLREVLAEYGELFMTALRLKATPRKHANVLYHLLGFLKRVLDAKDKSYVTEQIEAYRTGLVPLIVPVTLLKHHFHRHPADWVEEQTYLNPYPAELMLRNHV